MMGERIFTKNDHICVAYGSLVVYDFARDCLGFFSRILSSSVQHDHRLWWRGFWLLSVVSAGLVLGGCDEASLKLYPVRGQVFFKDQPAEGAKVVFLPAGEENAQYRGARPAATLTADGSFEMETEPYGAGAPVGDYVVLMTWFPPRDENPNANAKNKLPNKYGDPSNPLLKASVKEAENKLDPFKLTP